MLQGRPDTRRVWDPLHARHPGGPAPTVVAGQGFTLIELIAVLVVLGVLAATASIKYYDLQHEAEQRAIEGALAALASAASKDYAQAVLAGTASGTSWGGSATVVVGDFSGTYADASGLVSLTIVSGPSWVNSLSASERSATVRVY